MENSKKAVVLAIVSCLWCCKGNGAPSNNSIDTLSTSSRKSPNHREFPSAGIQEEKKFLRAGLYEDSGGALFLRVKNRSLRHPSQMNKPREDSIFLFQVFDEVENRTRLLSDVVDSRTFARENPFGSYFMDSARVFIYSIPHPVQFIAVERGGETFLGAEKEYLLLHGVLYYLGIKVEGLNNAKLSILKYPEVGKNGFHEFITDNEKIFVGAYPLNKERLGLIDGLSDRDKKEIARRFKLN